MNQLALIGSAFGFGAQIHATAQGPEYLQNTYHITDKLSALGIEAEWKSILKKDYDLTEVPTKGKHFNAVHEHATHLAEVLQAVVTDKSNPFPVVVGGDHSAAVGTWSGVINSLQAHQDFGLIWVDAHMDAHTAQTSPSKAYHGMPVSVLLGHGDEQLGFIGGAQPKIKPEHLVLIGVRSFEDEEAKLLSRLGVKVFTSQEVFEKGMQTVLEEALAIVSRAKKGFGISFDMDAIDPKEAPGVGSPEAQGLSWKEVEKSFPKLLQHPMLQALEIVEFNPELDLNNQTAEKVLQLIVMLKKLG